MCQKMLKDKPQRWLNITKEAVEDLPYAQWLEEGKWKHTKLPQTKTVEKMAQVAKKTAEEIEKEDDQARRKIAKDKMQEDMRNGGAAAHKAVKIALGAEKEYVQPTHTIQTEEGINSDPNQVHKAFTKEWTKHVFRLQRKKPERKLSKKKMESIYPRYRTLMVRSMGRTCSKRSNKLEKQYRAWMDGESTS